MVLKSDARIGDLVATSDSLSTLADLYQEIFVDLKYFFVAERPDPLIIDCGSNIGLSVLFFKMLYPQARIIGFEPGPGAFELLCQNVHRNNLVGVELHRCALGGEVGSVDFYYGPSRPGSPLMSTSPGRGPTGKTVVDQVKLSSIVTEEVDFLKIDVEGAEESILEDLVVFRAIDRVDRMVVEYHHHVDPHRNTLGGLLQRLEDAHFGYQIGASALPSTRLADGGVLQDIAIYAYRLPRSGSANGGPRLRPGVRLVPA